MILARLAVICFGVIRLSAKTRALCAGCGRAGERAGNGIMPLQVKSDDKVVRIMKANGMKTVGKNGKSILGRLWKNERENWKMWAAVWFLFIAAAVIHGLVLPAPHVLYTYYDEILYWGTAKTFWTQPAFTVYHMTVEFGKFIYAMVLSPLFLIKDSVLRAEAAGWLNMVMICFSVFPAYRLVRRLSPSKIVQLTSLVLFMCSPILGYGEKYAPECLYLPIVLYLILGYYVLYEKMSNEKSCSLKRLIVRAALMGVFACVCYLEKEAASAFTAAFVIWTLVLALKKKKLQDPEWKRYLAAAAVHAGVMGACYLAVKLAVGLQFSYSGQVGLSNINSMFKIEFLVYCIISNGLYCCVAFFGLPVLYWQIKKNRKGRLAEEGAVHYQWVVFFLAALALTVVFLSFGVSVKEELGNRKIRLHTRYYIPFLLPFFALVLEEIRKAPKRGGRAGVALVLGVGIACVLMLGPNRYVSTYDSLDTWHIQDAAVYFDDLAKAAEEEKQPADGEEQAGWKTALKDFFSKQTDGSKEVSFNHGVLIAMLAYTALTVAVVLLVNRSPGKGFALLCCLVLAVEGYNNVISTQRLGRFSTISAAAAQAYGQLDRDVCALVGDENLLVINNDKFETGKRRLETFLSVDWYSVYTSGLNRVLGENGAIDLSNTALTVSMGNFVSSRRYPKGTTISYVLCTKDVLFNESCVEQVLYSKDTGYYLYKVLDPAFLDVDYIKDLYEENAN